ncbi:hypothetical protein AMTRI_Chr12g270300 [Amborella trichopoda]|uniref:Protein kinase domain-containing protein n=1 Tax=Amborella trichopoda TaxID=13333 RepID=W1PFS1_AMBTC|nr:mitogen-activated protein kinase kinase kinase 3 [Amborella trichopoda]ERN08837.1 hypothetical protein AMTR_s00015p00050440 [Amborella trichopoda]|eukprot:XP_006847256.1 mitogen-activated protein kinase kinase kinase 3 [Amborella trichopoda]
MEWEKGACIGQGSFGTVSLGTLHTRSEIQTVAVKTAPFASSWSLQNEQRVLACLDSPHVVRCFAHEQRADAYNLFLEYVPGGSLLNLIQSRGHGLSELEAQTHARGILQGILCIHDAGFVHCDIKPHNILLSSSSSSSSCFAKIIDLGLAKPKDYCHSFLSIRGTPLYMSPETVRAKRQDEASDIWAFGCTVLEMLTGKQPWREVDDLCSLLLRIGYGDEGPEVPLDLSEKARDFLGKCLFRDPEKRWTAAQLLQHPFVDVKVERENTTIETPRSVLDCDLWCSSLASSCDWDCYCDREHGKGNRGERISTFDRIRRLASSSQRRPNWSFSSVHWIDVKRREIKESQEQEGGSDSSTSRVVAEDQPSVSGANPASFVSMGSFFQELKEEEESMYIISPVSHCDDSMNSIHNFLSLDFNMN